MITVAIINKSTVVTEEAEVRKVVDALQEQVTKHFMPIWGIDAQVKYVSTVGAIPRGAWLLAILDDSDQAGALGYHDVTRDGLPLGKVFAKTDMTYNEKWSVTASHELLEMLGDPDINLSAFVESQTSARLYAYETCDAVEAIEYQATNGVWLSDFVTPAWFEAFQKDGPFDFKEQVKKPFEITSGGYIGYYDVKAGSGWQQETAQTTSPGRSALLSRNRPHVGSRRERRRTPREQWQKSDYRA